MVPRGTQELELNCVDKSQWEISALFVGRLLLAACKSKALGGFPTMFHVEQWEFHRKSAISGLFHVKQLASTNLSLL